MKLILLVSYPSGWYGNCTFIILSENKRNYNQKLTRKVEKTIAASRSFLSKMPEWQGLEAVGRLKMAMIRMPCGNNACR
jgi:hypothetical protein